MPVLETRGLTKDFGGKGLFDLDLRVSKGTIHGFLGPNGAGKTTCMRLLMDLLRPTRGGARVLGVDPRQAPKTVRARVGYLPGELALPEHLTGRQFLHDSAVIRGDVDEAWRDELVARLGAQLSPKIRNLSKGNKQKIALLDALQHRAPLWILDEPTDGLDPLLRRQVDGLIRDHAHGGGTVFLSSHVVHEIQTTCDEVSMLIAGRLRRQENILHLLATEPTRVQCRLPAGDAAQLAGTPGVTSIERRGDQVRFRLKGDLLPCMQRLIEVGAKDVVVRQHDLEETFLRLFEAHG